MSVSHVGGPHAKPLFHVATHSTQPQPFFRTLRLSAVRLVYLASLTKTVARLTFSTVSKFSITWAGQSDWAGILFRLLSAVTTTMRDSANPHLRQQIHRV